MAREDTAKLASELLASPHDDLVRFIATKLGELNRADELARMLQNRVMLSRDREPNEDDDNPYSRQGVHTLVRMFGAYGCEVYCKHKGKPPEELVTELSKFFVLSVGVSLNIKPDSVLLPLGIACSVYFVKTIAGFACAC